MKDLSVESVKNQIWYDEVLSDDELWKIALGRELMEARKGNLIKGFSRNEIDEMLSFICIS